MRRIVISLCLIFTLLALPFAAFGASSEQLSLSGVAWLKTRQLSDGGFETAGFAGFETPDAILAIAEAAQTTNNWNSAAARMAVRGVRNSANRSPFSWADDWAEGTLDPGQAANLITLVIIPLGFNPADFDPLNDSGAAVNVIKVIDNAGGNYGAFNATLRVGEALYLARKSIPVSIVNAIINAQQADGAWNFAGDPAGSDPGADTTGSALEVLGIALSVETDLPKQQVILSSINKAVSYLALTQQPSGAWQSIGSDDPNSTALVLRGLRAAGVNTTNSCWKGTVASIPYVNPVDFLANSQASDGHVVSPFDGFGVNTSATSQTITALSGKWLPAARATRNCVQVLGAQVQSADAGGYGIVSGDTMPFGGTARIFGDTTFASPADVEFRYSGLARTPTNNGLWLTKSDGGVFSFGDAKFFGSAFGLLFAPAVDIESTLSGNGYWVLTSDGGVFSFGDAKFFGSAYGKITGEAVGLARTAGNGYRIAATDGGVFSFGDAKFHGSATSLNLVAGVVAIEAAPDGGYWLLGGDGGVFSFAASFHGSVPGLGISERSVAIVSNDYDGYWVIGQNGGVFSFNVPFRGSSFGSGTVRAAG